MRSPRQPATASLENSFVCAEADLAAAARLWLRRLAGERRVSTLTLDAYARDLRQFLSFLRDRFTTSPDLAQLAELKPADLRAFLARRREDGVASRSLAAPIGGPALVRASSGPRRSGECRVFDKVRSPKVARALPKALPAARAREMASGEDAGRRAPGALDPGARRGGAGFALRGGLAHFRGPVDPARRRAGRGRRFADHHRQGRQDARRAGHLRRSGRRSRPISKAVPIASPRTGRCSSARAAARCRRESSS